MRIFLKTKTLKRRVFLGTQVFYMTKTAVISVRVPNEVREKLEEYAEILRIRPSAIAALVLEDCIEYWVKQYSENALKRIWENL